RIGSQPRSCCSQPRGARAWSSGTLAVGRPRCGLPRRRPVMGKYLDLLAGAAARREISDKSEKTDSDSCSDIDGHNLQPPFLRLTRFSRTFSKLERRCPEYVAPDRWQIAVEDAKRFLAQWGERAEALGWTRATCLAWMKSQPIRTRGIPV